MMLRIRRISGATATQGSIVLLMLGVINMQPGLFGYISNKPLIVLVFVCGLYLARPNKYKKQLSFPPQIAALFALSLFLVARVLFDDVALKTAHVDYMFITLALAFVGAFGGEIVSHAGEQELALKVFIYFIGILSLSACITEVISLIVPSLSLTLTSFALNRTDSAGADRWIVYFPFTVTSAATWVGGRLIPRATGIFREPGIFQAYLITALVLLRRIKVRFRYTLATTLCGALILTFSSIGYPLAIATGVYIVLTMSKRYWLKFAVVVFAVVGALALWSFKPLDYQAKMVESLNTEDSRVTATIDSFTYFPEHPIIGTGIFVDLPGDLGLEGVSFLSSVHMFGLVGIALYILTAVLAIKRNYRIRDLDILIPLVGTAIFSQPMYFDAITFILLSLNIMKLSPAAKPKLLHTNAPLARPTRDCQNLQQTPG